MTNKELFQAMLSGTQLRFNHAVAGLSCPRLFYVVGIEPESGGENIHDWNVKVKVKDGLEFGEVHTKYVRCHPTEDVSWP